MFPMEPEPTITISHDDDVENKVLKEVLVLDHGEDPEG